MDDKVCVCNACTIEGGHSGHRIKTLKNTMKDLKVLVITNYTASHSLPERSASHGAAVTHHLKTDVRLLLFPVIFVIF